MRASIVLLALAIFTNFLFADQQPASVHPVPGDAQDLVLLLDSHPYRIRLHLQINGRSFRVNWDESIAHLFRYLDVDGNGLLSKKEAALAPSKTQWEQLTTAVVVEPDAAPEFAELAGSATAANVTREHFSLYYRNSGAGAIRIEWGWRPPSEDRQSNTLFQLLDKDKDGSLSRTELLSAQDALHLLDINGDDLIQATELPSGYYYPAFSFQVSTGEQPAPAHFPFAIVQPDAPAAALAGVLLKRYGRDNQGSLSRTQFPVEKTIFDRLDANRDERLNASEIAEWRKLPPDLEFLIALEAGARRDILLLPGGDGKQNRLIAALPSGRDGVVRIPLAGKQLEVARYSLRAKERGELLKKFEALAGKDNVIDEKRIYQPPFAFVALLRLADRDADNRLSRKELVDYLDVQEKYLYRTSYLTILDRGASLFEFLDADHDGRLSPRELRTAWKRLSIWDRDRAGRISRRQVPRQFQFVLSYGQSRAQLPMLEQGFANLPMTRDHSQGPLWFRKMDRNGDGDVSQNEFLGTMEQFRRIDRDGDGLIDLVEAEQADKDFRKRHERND